MRVTMRFGTMVFASLLAGTFMPGCLTTTCSTGTHRLGDNCVADSATSATCGPNTTLDSTSGACTLMASACGPGTVLNTTTSTCQVDANHGDLIWSSTNDPDWSVVFYNPTPASGPGTIIPVGDENGPAPGVSDSTPLVMADGTPMGGVPPIPASWGTGAPDSTTLVANTKQLTVGDWKACKSTWSLYKNPPKGKAGDIRVIVQVQGCPANISFSLWHTFYTSDQYDSIYLGSPLGGVPSAFNTNADGTGFFERDLDPNIWFKAGGDIGGAAHGAAAKIPSVADFPTAHYAVDLVYHNTGQSNGNMGWCARDASNNCVSSPSPNVLLPGQLGIDSGGILTGAKVSMGGSTSTKPVPLGMLQPQ